MKKAVNILAMIFIAFLILIPLLVSGHATGTNVGACVYTFNVPRDANSCPPGSQDSEVTLVNLKASMDSQHEQLKEKLQNLTHMISSQNGQDNQPATKSGTHYTRWGSSTCPDTAQLIYNGYMANSYYSQGGGVNFLCLPTDPKFPSNVASGGQSKSYIYGVEYYRSGSPLIPSSKDHNDVPCAVCHVNDKGEQLMIPANTTCPAGWTNAYTGILMAEYHSHQSSTFVCVDSGLEVIPGGQSLLHGGLIYVVEAKCGALPCPPYRDGYEIMCCVCTL